MIKLLFLLILSITNTAYAIPRGIENNNPGNIEYNKTNKWKGQTGHDGRFVKFDTEINGIRSLVILLQNKIEGKTASSLGRKLDNIQKLGFNYAPTHENDTNKYIDCIEHYSKVNKKDIITKDLLTQVVRGIIICENGYNPYKNLDKIVKRFIK